jgi:hypothetical protein
MRISKLPLRATASSGFASRTFPTRAAAPGEHFVRELAELVDPDTRGHVAGGGDTRPDCRDNDIHKACAIWISRD